jgi:hypothetical protein
MSLKTRASKRREVTELLRVQTAGLLDAGSKMAQTYLSSIDVIEAEGKKFWKNVAKLLATFCSNVLVGIIAILFF